MYLCTYYAHIVSAEFVNVCMYICIYVCIQDAEWVHVPSMTECLPGDIIFLSTVMAEDKDTTNTAKEELLYCAMMVAVQNENLEFMVASSSSLMPGGRATGNGDSCSTLLRTLRITKDEDVATALLSEQTTLEMKDYVCTDLQPVVYIVRAAKIVRNIDDS